MEFYKKTGKMAISSRLRRLSEKMTEQAGLICELYGVDIQPKWFPVFYTLADGQARSIMQIAQEIGHSHPSVSIIVKEMTKEGLIGEGGDNKTDGRKNFIKLNEKGLAINEHIKYQYVDVNAAIENAIAESQYDLWKAIEEWEFLLEQKDMLTRVKDEKKLRESKDVQIIDYTPEYRQAFKQLNEEWITQYFKLEDSDRKALDHAQDYILGKGGYILVALYQGEPLGVCALIKMDEHKFELAKMAVSPEAKGKGIGFMLGNAAIEKAHGAGATSLYLESNTILKPAINLYHKLGFKKITGVPSPYERCNIQMERAI